MYLASVEDNGNIACQLARGSNHWRERLPTIKPAVHAFGHIHEGAGVTTDGSTLYVNASTCNLRYRPINQPIVVDVLPPDPASGRARAEVVMGGRTHEL